MIIDKVGNIFDTEAKMIGHGVNACGVMGGGIALQFRERYPAMHEAYVNICKAATNPLESLPGKVMFWEESDFCVANLFTQDKPGPNARYSWTISALKDAFEVAEEYKFSSIAIPRIGCGIGGLDWAQMYYYLLEAFGEHEIDLEVWTYNNTEEQ